jgi:hypothetical protein
MARYKRFPNSVYNPISLFGAILAIGGFVAIMLLIFYDRVLQPLPPYFGIVVFIILPAFLVLGLILIPVGMFYERKRRTRTGDLTHTKSIHIDFDQPAHRRAAIVFGSGTIIFLLATAMGTYWTYEFTESVTFCGEVCHTIMEPEHTAYQKSPHARVTCVECHVGAGADWYVKSKLSGAYQVYAATFNLYPRPIPTPIENLRPARETCEQCHWPDKFHGSRARTFNHFKIDEENSYWPIRMLIRTGGGDRETGEAEGIHWHLSLYSQVDYIATDRQRQVIPWVRVRDRDGNEKIYQDEYEPIDPDSLGNYEIRTMSCIDCHNRPSHIYNSPSRAVNESLASGQIATDLPSAKRIAIESLLAEYSTKDSALAAIGEYIRSSYADEYPDVAESRGEDIEQMIVEVKDIYQFNFFPEMKVRWDVYPDNIGHFSSPGCYRCHDGKHVAEDGSTIGDDCSSCHVILAQGPESGATISVDVDGVEFIHPEDIDEAWKEMACSECHTGASQL